MVRFGEAGLTPAPCKEALDIPKRLTVTVVPVASKIPLIERLAAHL
jgi:hypothetical protein